MMDDDIRLHGVAKFVAKANQINDYLTDNEISPKPVAGLCGIPYEYFEQLVDSAQHWNAETRLTIASMIIGEPLKVQGAEDCIFSLPSNDDASALWKSGFLTIEIIGARLVDMNRPGRHALERMAESGASVDYGFMILYNFLHELKRQGIFDNLNYIIRADEMNPVLVGKLRDAERALLTKIFNVLIECEGRTPGEDRAVGED